jgi:hypothetical protein
MICARLEGRPRRAGWACYAELSGSASAGGGSSSTLERPGTALGGGAAGLLAVNSKITNISIQCNTYFEL